MKMQGAAGTICEGKERAKKSESARLLLPFEWLKIGNVLQKKVHCQTQDILKNQHYIFLVSD